MTLQLFHHPFSSYCQKALVALYERAVPFEGMIVDLGDPAQRAALAALWPVAKFPVLRDRARGTIVPEASLIVAYLDRVAPGPPPLIPADPDAALEVHVLDRFFDNYIHLPLQKVVGDSLRPADGRDPHGVAEAKAQIARSWAILDDMLAHGRDWAAGADFTLADCAAAPAMFYANIVVPFAGRARVESYYARLTARPSFARAVDEARPSRTLFPLEWPAGYA